MNDARSASATSITVTIPKLLVMVNGDAMSAEKPNMVVRPDGMIAFPIFALASRMASTGANPFSFSS